MYDFLDQPNHAGAKSSILLSCFSHVFLRERRHACVHRPYPPDRSAITTELLLKLAVRLLKERGREGGGIVRGVYRQVLVFLHRVKRFSDS